MSVGNNQSPACVIPSPVHSVHLNTSLKLHPQVICIFRYFGERSTLLQLAIKRGSCFLRFLVCRKLIISVSSACRQLQAACAHLYTLGWREAL